MGFEWHSLDPYHSLLCLILLDVPPGAFLTTIHIMIVVASERENHVNMYLERTHSLAQSSWRTTNSKMYETLTGYDYSSN